MILDDGDSKRRHRFGRGLGLAKRCDESWDSGRRATDLFLPTYAFLIIAPRNPSIALRVAGYHRVS